MAVSYPMPGWVDHAFRHQGLKEAKGSANNPTILSWAKELGIKILGIVYNADATAWCGLFVAHCLKEAGIDLLKMDKQTIAIRAKAWATWGVHTPPRYGCILVFERPGGGHVGFYVGEDSKYYYVLGGNQGDMVSVMKIERSRMIATRWPRGSDMVTKRVIVDDKGIPVSNNEA